VGLLRFVNSSQFICRKYSQSLVAQRRIVGVNENIYKKIAVNQLLAFKQVYELNKQKIDSFNLVASCRTRDVFREVRQSTTVHNSLELINQLQATDIEVGSFLAHHDSSKMLTGINLLLKRVEDTESDLKCLISPENKGKTFSALIGIPKKDPFRYLKKFDLLLENASKYNICLKPAFFMSADNEYSLKNQNMSSIQVLDLHSKVFDSFKENQLKTDLKNSILYISMPSSDLDMTANMIKAFPGLVSFGDTFGSMTKADLNLLTDKLKQFDFKMSNVSLHLHGNPGLSLDEDVTRMFELLLQFFSNKGSVIDGNNLPMGFKNQLSGSSSQFERSGNMSFRLLTQVLVSLNIGDFESHVETYSKLLYLQEITNSTDLFEGEFANLFHDVLQSY
jgi:hypothetical protein